MEIKFISYDGKYPTLCYGTLTIECDGQTYRFQEPLSSGGACGFDGDWNDKVTKGDWEWEICFKLPPELKPFANDILKVINENIETRGCCGGCL